MSSSKGHTSQCCCAHYLIRIGRYRLPHRKSFQARKLRRMFINKVSQPQHEAPPFGSYSVPTVSNMNWLPTPGMESNTVQPRPSWKSPFRTLTARFTSSTLPSHFCYSLAGERICNLEFGTIKRIHKLSINEETGLDLRGSHGVVSAE